MCISLRTRFVRALKTNIFKQALKQRMMCKSFTNCGKKGQNKKQISYINISDQGKTTVKKRCKKMWISTTH